MFRPYSATRTLRLEDLDYIVLIQIKVKMKVQSSKARVTWVLQV